MTEQDDKLRDYLKRVTRDLRRARQELNDIELRQHEPIAIVGVGCRYPGGVRCGEDLWQLVDSGKEGIGELPSSRGWQLDELYDPELLRPGTTYVREGGFLYDADEFDAAFFGIGPREALAMDPQQRLLLEVCWEACEHAGVDPHSLHGSDTAVFAAIGSYGYGLSTGAHVEAQQGYGLTGCSCSAASGRIAYILGLKGPAISVDTACSSSLVGLHLASQALRRGECSLSLVGGVCVMAGPQIFVDFSRQRGLAADGRCKPFAEAADGTAWGEGVGVVLLERLSDARRFGHQTLALICGSAVNQDGESNGLTAPNGPSQQRVIEDALLDARISSQAVDVVEAHGTGTTLGDPIEAQALLATYGQRPSERPLWLGSIKSNLGHTQASAGMAGVIKMVMALQNERLPKTLHVDEPSRKVDWSTGAVSLLTEPVPWPRTEETRRAGVSAFGISGTNAHLILEEAPAQDADPPAPAVRAAGPMAVPLCFSAKSEAALLGQAERLREHLAERPELEPLDVAFSLAVGRGRMEHRAAIVAGDRVALLGGLDALLAGDPAAHSSRAIAAGSGKVAFMFSGQGSQWAGMGQGLYERFGSFAGSLDSVCEQLDPLLERSLKELLFACEDSGALDRTEFTQAGLFALEVALFRLLESWGIRPNFLIGHSIGEVVAAHVAGALSLGDACALVAARGRLMGALEEGGAMLAVQARESQVRDSLDGLGDRLAIAAINAPNAVVVSGDRRALSEWSERWEGTKTKWLQVSHAFHSPLMEPMLEQFQEVLAGLELGAPEIPIISNLTGEPAGEEMCTPEYWVRHVRETVRFGDGVNWLRSAGVRCFLEIGPDGVLSAMANECLKGEGALVVPTMRARRPGEGSVMQLLAEAFTHGLQIDWDAVFAEHSPRRVSLPTYAFQRERYWLAPGAGNVSTAGLTNADHSLLGAATGVAGQDEWLLTGSVSLQTHQWLGDHLAFGVPVVPGTAFVELALRAGREVACEEIEELTLQAPLVLTERSATQLQVRVGEPDERGSREIVIHSRPASVSRDRLEEELWTRHATGRIRAGGSSELVAPELVGEAWPPVAAQSIDADYVYERLAEVGFSYGPAFQGLIGAWRRGEEIFAEVALPDEQVSGRYTIHPALFDAILQTGAIAAVGERASDGTDGRRGMMPFSWNGVQVKDSDARVLRARLVTTGDALSVLASDEAGIPVVSVRRLTARPVDAEQLRARAGGMQADQFGFGLEWVEVDAPVRSGAGPIMAILGDVGVEGLDIPRVPDVAALAEMRGEDAPNVVIAPIATGGELPVAAYDAAQSTLDLLQAWLGEKRLGDARLVLLTRGAVAREGEAIEPAGAGVWGLVRSAQAEHPGRFLLIDLQDDRNSQDGWAFSMDTFTDALTLALDGDETQLAIRGNEVRALRLKRVAMADAPNEQMSFDAAGTVLITGGTGVLGGLVARHLVASGARHLLLVSRRGLDAEGAGELQAELCAAGAQVRVQACDVTDRDALARLLESIPGESPLTMVVHAAGILDDGVIESLDRERLEQVMRPKVAAAVWLDELTEGCELSDFIVFSSAAGTFGAPGQGNYAAANAVLDALMAHRHARGRSARSLAWGMWAQKSAMTGQLSEVDLARMRRTGMVPLSTERSLALFDAAHAIEEPLLLPVELDLSVWRSQAHQGVPALLRGLLRVLPTRKREKGGSLARRLAGVSESERAGVVLDLVRGHAAAVLGHPSADSIDPQRAFKELGFDSLGAVELRNRLEQATGIRLSSTLVFDHPTPTAIATHLLVQTRDDVRGGAVMRRSVTRTEEPVAIVGMACRFPGGVASPEDLWELVSRGGDGISEFPGDRGWDLGRLLDHDRDRAGTSYVHNGGFMADAGDFDAAFFGIGPREALTMDPQQRLLLEVAWEAIERAGIAPSSLRESDTGVFAGASAGEYGTASGGVPEFEGLRLTGNTMSVASGRVAYSLGLEGPAITVDTACSSSLVALHLACDTLRSGECSMALAGGVAVHSTPVMFVEFSRQRGLAPDGRCKSFAAAADGTSWSEGVGVLVLERLSDAQRQGHRVLALVRGSATNQDGASNGLTAPNGPSQERVIRQALANAGLSPTEVDAVEAHGTGTTLGDPIEAQALIATYGQERSGGPLRLGSIKSNIGHAGGAAGVAGVIKMVQAMRHGVLPATLHVDTPTPHVDWDAGEVRLLTEPLDWPGLERPRRAGVSSFGISGTNAHVILEQAPAHAEPERPDEPRHSSPPVVAWPLSAKSEQALREQAARLRAHLADRPELEPVDVAFSLAAGRDRLEHRAVLVGGERDGLLASLDALAAGDPMPSGVKGRERGAAKVAFMFPGQGSQWAGMAARLWESLPLFAERMQACEDALAPHVDFSLADVLRGVEGAPALQRVDVVQPALFAVMVSLAELWRACGVHPSVVVGHSQGEIAAACVAGGLSLGDAARVVALRSQALGELAGSGGMVSLGAGSVEVEELVARFDDRVSIAAFNGPRSTVVSGETRALDELLSACEAEGLRARRIPVDYASHSVAVEGIRKELLESLASIEPRSSEVPFFSTATGELIDTALLDAEYWYRGLRDPVLFAQATRRLIDEGATAFIEASPHPVLTMAVQEAIDHETSTARAVAIGSLRREEDERHRFALSLAEAFVNGVQVNWDALLGGRRRMVDLPTYAFQRDRYWLSPRTLSGDLVAAGITAAEHPLLGAAVSVAGQDEWLFTGQISPQTHPWLADHVVLGAVLFPATAFVELALNAGGRVGCEEIEELTLHAPLALHELNATQLQLSVGAPDEHGRRRLAIYSRPALLSADDADAEWTQHASGALRPMSEVASEPVAIDVSPPSNAQPIDIDYAYDRLAEAGFSYGPAFQGLRGVWRVDEELFVDVALEERQDGAGYAVHPALLDAILQAVALAALDGKTFAGMEGGSGTMPFSWRGVRMGADSPSALRARVSAEQGSLQIEASNAGGLPVLSVAELIARPVDAGQLRAATRVEGDRDSLFGLEWVEVAAPSHHGAGADVAILGEVSVEEIEGLSRHADLEGLIESLEERSEQGAAVKPPNVVVAEVAICGEELPEAIHDAAAKVLALMQAWLAAEPLSNARLVLLTRGAVSVDGAESPDLAGAGVWGLVRSAQSEHPGRFVLIDLDRDEPSPEALPHLLDTDEPQLATRRGKAYALRLKRLAAPELPARSGALEREGTILITGGTGVLGRLVARHLAESGARHLLLVSRQGSTAQGAVEFQEELRKLGAEAQLQSCDVADRAELAHLLSSIPRERPLRSVIHTAGVLDDGVIESLDRERLVRVLRAKADAAIYLHELTADCPLEEFVAFSSAAGTLGALGVGNYSAANAVLDALMTSRRAQGLPGISLAWGAWEQEGGMTADPIRMRRTGIVPLSNERALELFDIGLVTDEPVLLPVSLDLSVWRAPAREGLVPALLRGLVRSSTKRRRVLAGSLVARLAGVAEAEREGVVLELVCSHAAAVLGHSSPEAIDPERAFKELGFDSLSAVELRNRLEEATSIRLTSTLAFDHPTPAAVATFLLARSEDEPGRGVTVHRSARSEEPIAVVGLACRYPGGVGSAEDLWRLVAEGKDGMSEFPDDRGWDLDRLFDSDPDRAGTSYVGRGGFIEDVGHFDAAFFGISPREALAMDPQQRQLLEVAWEAFEHAGIDPTTLRGSATGVFAGISASDYATGFVSGRAGDLEGYLGTGMAGSVLSGRVAYSLGLEGPAVTVDTACSSSLVAIHLAAGALHAGECSLALAGGVTVLSTPGVFVTFSRQRGLSADGYCRSFAASADGAAFSEGVGLVALERLSDARRNGHRVLALVRGSATNQDGASNGLTAPNGLSQERVIGMALANAGLSAQEIDVVEAHGTGTTLGDPIEAQALLATYGRQRSGTPLCIGSIKSNIGHTQAAAGVAGVIKMVMAMRHGVLPATLHVDEPTPHVDWQAGAIRLLTEPRNWAQDGRPRRAGVSSFGISGTNAHLILEEPPHSRERKSAVADLDHSRDATGAAPPRADVKEPEHSLGVQSAIGPAPVAWVLSAKGHGALVGQAQRLRSYLGERPGHDPVGVALSLASDRAQLEDRAVVVGGDRDSLLAGLDALGLGDGVPGVICARARNAPKVAFMFSGQGSQWAGMGRDLHARFDVFAKAFDEACEELSPRLGRSVSELVFAAEGSQQATLLDRTEFTQAGLFALEVALYRLLDECGVRPSFLIGHSIGEIVAAHVAGVLSLPDACALVAARGRLMGALPAGGAMVAVQTSEAEALQSLQELEGAERLVSVAAVNGPSSVVLSGDEEIVQRLAVIWGERGRKAKRLAVSHAFHSPLMDDMLQELLLEAQAISFDPPRIPVVSNLTGEAVTAEQLCRPEYWVRHVRETVRFGEGVRWLAERGVTTYLELGPDGVLSGMVEECLASIDGDVGRDASIGGFAREDSAPASEIYEPIPATVPTLKRGDDQAQTLIECLARLWVRGVSVGWKAVLGDRSAAHVELPTYAFQRERYWLDCGLPGGDARAFGQSAVEHPLLGAAVAMADDEWLFTGRLSPGEHAWLAGHVVPDSPLLPVSALLEVAFQVGSHLGCDLVRELDLQEPLALNERHATQLQVRVGAADDVGNRSFGVYSRVEPLGDLVVDESEWSCNAVGSMGRAGQASSTQTLGQDGNWPPLGVEPVEAEELDDRLAEAGFERDRLEGGVTRAWRRGEEVFAEVELPSDETERGAGLGMHPALLEAAVRVTALVGEPDSGDAHDVVRLPALWRDVALLVGGVTALRVHLSHTDNGTATFVLGDESGRTVASIGTLQMREASVAELGKRADEQHEETFHVRWAPPPGAAPSFERAPLMTCARDVASALHSVGVDCQTFEDMEELAGALDGAEAASPAVLLDARAHYEADAPQGEDASLNVHAEGVPEAVATLLHRTLSSLQEWLADPRLSRCRLVVLTQRALATEPLEGARDLAGGALIGLIRSAQAESPGRFVLVDVDGNDASWHSLGDALAHDEPQLAVREGTICVPRIRRGPYSNEPRSLPGDDGPRQDGELEDTFDSQGTVLLTGATGGLGALVARHLVVAHGVRHLLLASRRGPDAPGATELVGELAGLGAQAQLVACDVSDREQVASLLSKVAEQHPLNSVIHAAGVVDDGLIGSLTTEQVDRVLAAKVGGAWHLHELTDGTPLRAFVLFSSVVGLIGGIGQANYGAANAFLDALAAHRRSLGLGATSIAWGMWARESEMTAHLQGLDRRRVSRAGMLALSDEQGLALLDEALRIDEPLVVSAALDAAALSVQIGAGALPAILREMVRARSRSSSRSSRRSFVRLLARSAEEERARLVLDLVRAEAARVLGHPTPEAIDTKRAFKDLGFTSLAGVELRNRLAFQVDVGLPATLIFDYPTPTVLAQALLEELAPEQEANRSLERELNQLEQTLAAIPASDPRRDRASARLQALLEGLSGTNGSQHTPAVTEQTLRSASAEELYAFIDTQLGQS